MRCLTEDVLVEHQRHRPIGDNEDTVPNTHIPVVFNARADMTPLVCNETANERYDNQNSLSITFINLVVKVLSSVES